MTTVYDNSTNPIFQQTPSTYLDENSDRLTPSPASYPTPSSNTVSPESYIQSSPANYPNFYPSPESTNSSAGSPLAATSLPEADQTESNDTVSLAGSATYSHEGQNCNFYEYMYSSFPAYQHQTPSFYPSQMNSVPDGDFYQAHSSYFTNHPYYPYLYSNRPSPTPQCNLYNRQLLTQDLNSTSQTLNVIPKPSQNSSTTVQHPADSSTDHTPSSTLQPTSPSTDPTQKYPPVLVKGGGKIRAKPVRRTEFSAADLRILEEHFTVSDFARGARRDEIARQLNVRPRSITIWFQNKRAKLRARNQQLDLLKKAAATGVVQDFEKISDFR